MKLPIKSITEGIITKGTYMGFYGVNVVLGGKKKYKEQKIISNIMKHNGKIVIFSADTDPLAYSITNICTALIRSVHIVVLNCNGKYYSDSFPFVPNSCCLVVTPTGKKIDSRLENFITIFNYLISYDIKSANDGLPSKLYHPVNDSRIMITPRPEKKKKRFKLNCIKTKEIAKQYGYFIGDMINVANC